jgi:hypothetical protein
MVDEKSIDGHIEEYDPPRWLKLAIEASRVSPEFDARCREAGEVALDLARMRREKSKEQGFVDLPLGSYLEGIAQLASVDLRRILGWLRIPNLDVLDVPTAKGVVRLCRASGLSLRETLAHVRISFAEASGLSPFADEVFQRGGGRHGLDRCEAVLAEAETGYDLSVLHHIRQLEAAIHFAYQEVD